MELVRFRQRDDSGQTATTQRDDDRPRAIGRPGTTPKGPYWPRPTHIHHIATRTRSVYHTSICDTRGPRYPRDICNIIIIIIVSRRMRKLTSHDAPYVIFTLNFTRHRGSRRRVPRHEATKKGKKTQKPKKRFPNLCVFCFSFESLYFRKKINRTFFFPPANYRVDRDEGATRML